MLGMMALAIKILIPVARGPPGGRAEPRERPFGLEVSVAVALGLPFDELRPSPPAAAATRKTENERQVSYNRSLRSSVRVETHHGFKFYVSVARRVYRLLCVRHVHKKPPR